jgi:hypothetical protein
MAVIGFHYTKMLAEKKKSISGKVNVNSNIVVTNIKEAKITGDTKQKGAEFSFKFETKYDPAIGTIELEGALVYLGEGDKVKDILEHWSTDKKLAPEIIEEVYNYVLARCNIETLMLGKDMQLPPHIPLPKITGEKKG